MMETMSLEMLDGQLPKNKPPIEEPVSFRLHEGRWSVIGGSSRLVREIDQGLIYD
jgi:hypothetical protein